MIRLLPNPRGWTAMAIAAAALAAPVAAQEPPPQDLGAAQEALRQWVETERVISKEKRDLELSREVLKERTELVRREIEAVRERIAQAEASITEADRKRDELLARNEELKQTSATAEQLLAGLEKGVVALLERSPESLRERVRPLSQRIPPDPAETKLGASERFQNVVGILNEMNRFHQQLSVTSEVMDLPDGTTLEVKVLYLGMAQAIYSGAGGTLAGVGSGASGKWEWKAANDAAGDAAAAFAILAGDQLAAFVQAPLEKPKP